jgi:hypothetical protein
MTQRSPLIFWLLLAATLAVDAVAAFWLSQDSNLLAPATLYGALVLSQLSVVVIWWSLAAHSRALALWAWTALPLSLLLASVVTARVIDDFPIGELCTLYGAHVALLIALLWIARQTKLWRRIRPGEVSSNWQFSVGQLLAVMTVIAVLIGSLQNTQFLHFAWAELAVEVSISSTCAVACVIVWLRRTHLAIRLASLLAITFFIDMAAMIASAAIIYFNPQSSLPLSNRPFPVLYDFAGSVIQCLVIFAWLEIGQVIPRSETEDIGPSGRAGLARQG